jgi:hypothetical protein
MKMTKVLLAAAILSGMSGNIIALPQQDIDNIKASLGGYDPQTQERLQSIFAKNGTNADDINANAEARFSLYVLTAPEAEQLAGTMGYTRDQMLTRVFGWLSYNYGYQQRLYKDIGGGQSEFVGYERMLDLDGIDDIELLRTILQVMPDGNRGVNGDIRERISFSLFARYNALQGVVQDEVSDMLVTLLNNPELDFRMINDNPRRETLMQVFMRQDITEYERDLCFYAMLDPQLRGIVDANKLHDFLQNVDVTVTDRTDIRWMFEAIAHRNGDNNFDFRVKLLTSPVVPQILADLNITKERLYRIVDRYLRSTPLVLDFVTNDAELSDFLNILLNGENQRKQDFRIFVKFNQDAQNLISQSGIAPDVLQERIEDIIQIQGLYFNDIRDDGARMSLLQQVLDEAKNSQLEEVLPEEEDTQL